jgi:hypothetical protein
MPRRMAFLLLGALLFALTVCGVAVAGYAPQDIYDDYSSDGDLDYTYTDVELRAYLEDGHVHEYGDPSITSDLDQVALSLSSRDVFPVSGFQIAMAVLVVVILIVGGIMLRRLSRPRRPTQPMEPTEPPEDTKPPESSDES